MSQKRKTDRRLAGRPDNGGLVMTRGHGESLFVRPPHGPPVIVTIFGSRVQVHVQAPDEYQIDRGQFEDPPGVPARPDSNAA